MNTASLSLAPSTPPSAPAAPKSADAGPKGTPAAEAGDKPSFDRMLDGDGRASGAPAEAAVTADSAAADATAGAAANAASHEPAPANDAPPSTALPDQLLAMLGALAPAAAPPPTAAAPQGGGAASAPAATARPTAAAPSLAAALPGLAAAANATGPAAALPADAAPVEFAAALADARGEATSTAPDAPAGLFAPAPAAGPLATARPVAAVPLLDAVAMPADPQGGFDDAFGSRIVWMAEQRVGHADIRITPEHLGTIEVRVQLDGTQVRAEFFSAQADVRQALESGMARLRDQLGQHGLQLAQADVGQQRSGDAPPQPQGQGVDGEPADAAPAASSVVRARRLLDEIA